jgi:hypothetical protein
MPNYRSSPILRRYQSDLDARVMINRSLRRIDASFGQKDLDAAKGEK